MEGWFISFFNCVMNFPSWVVSRSGFCSTLIFPWGWIENFRTPSWTCLWITGVLCGSPNYQPFCARPWQGLKKNWPFQVSSALLFQFDKKLLVSQSLFPTTDGDIPPLSLAQTPKSQLRKICLDSLVITYEKARKELWDRLPFFFGLSTREELKDFDAYNSSDT